MIESGADEVTKRRVLDTIRRQLGRNVISCMEDPDVAEVMLNPDGVLWADKFSTGMEQIGCLAPETARAAIGEIASLLNKVVTDERPVLECELPIRAARFTALDRQIVPAPTFTIRMLAVKVFTLQDYVASGIMTEGQRRVIEDAAATGRNIMVAGGTGSGKTTLINAILAYVAEECPNDRLVVLEQLYELQIKSKNVVRIRPDDDTNFTFTRAVRTVMRLRPDRIIVGEVRGGEAHPLNKALNTGHQGGLWTIHANNAASALSRYEDLIAEAGVTPVRSQIADAVHFVVSICKTARGRQVQEILRVRGIDGNGNYILENAE